MEESVRQHIRQIAFRELASGKSPEEVLHLAEAVGISRKHIVEDLGIVLLENPDASFSAALQRFLVSLREDSSESVLEISSEAVPDSSETSEISPETQQKSLPHEDVVPSTVVQPLSNADEEKPTSPSFASEDLLPIPESEKQTESLPISDDSPHPNGKLLEEEENPRQEPSSSPESSHLPDDMPSQKEESPASLSPAELNILPLPFLGSASEQMESLKAQSIAHESSAPHDSSQEGTLWDILGERITPDRFASARKNLEEKLDAYQKHPTSIRRNTILFAVPAVLTFLTVLLHPSIVTTFSHLDDDGNGISLLLLPFVPVVLYIGYIFRVQRKLVKILVAKTRNWVFSPENRYGRWQDLTKKYPEIFQKGNKGQNIQEEFWGNMFFDGKEICFWMGIFEYVVENNTGKHRNRTKHTNTVFALPLTKKLHSDFCLKPEDFGMKILNSLFRRNTEIETESVDFNSAYAVFYNGKKVDNELEIVKTLSPSVQIRLVNLNKKWKCTILFRENAVVFSLKGRFLSWGKMKTNFLRTIALDHRDQEFFENQILEFVHLSGDIAPFLD